MKRKQLEKEAGSHMAFKVPNTDEGRAFLASMKKYRAGGTCSTVRGRGPRTKHALAAARGRRGFDQSLPKRFAEWLAVYIEKSKLVQISKATHEQVKRHLEAMILKDLEHQRQRADKEGEGDLELNVLLNIWKKTRKIELADRFTKES